MIRHNTPSEAPFVLLLLLSQSISAAAGDDDRPSERRLDPLEIEAAFTYESLTNNAADWRSAYFEILKKFDPRTALYGSFRQTQRFSLSDQEFLAGIYYPLAADLSLFSDVSMSPSHHLLPQWAAVAELQKGFAGGWVLHAAYRHIEFENAPTNLGYFLAERYWGEFRASYTLYVSHLRGSTTTLSHRITGSWYYEENNALNVSFSLGDEAENVGPPRGVLTSRVAAYSVFGRHWLTDAWACTYELLILQQADFYTRRGIRLGIRYRI